MNVIKDEKIKPDFNRYNNAKVYKLISDVDECFFIDSTCTSLAKILRVHKAVSKKKVYTHFNIIDWEHVKIILINEYYLDNKEQMLREEDIYIKCIKMTICLNSLRAYLNTEDKK